MGNCAPLLPALQNAAALNIEETSCRGRTTFADVKSDGPRCSTMPVGLRGILKIIINIYRRTDRCSKASSLSSLRTPSRAQACSLAAEGRHDSLQGSNPQSLPLRTAFGAAPRNQPASPANLAQACHTFNNAVVSHWVGLDWIGLDWMAWHGMVLYCIAWDCNITLHCMRISTRVYGSYDVLPCHYGIPQRDLRQ